MGSHLLRTRSMEHARGPANGASVKGTAVTLAASAADAGGVTKVEFRATGGSLSNALLGTGTKSGSVWIFVWNSMASR